MTIQLYPYQRKAADHLTSILSRSNAALDASDTGTGKTFTALGVCQDLKLKPLIICPKSIVTAWRRAAEALGVEILDVLNIEKLKTGKTPYLLRKAKNQWAWRLPPGSLVIYDEVQSASGFKSQNGKVLALTKAFGLKVLALSATAADSPLKLRALGYILGLHKWRDHYRWCRERGCHANRWGGLEFAKGPVAERYMKQLNGELFPEKGCRISIKDLDSFPENAIFAQSYDLDERQDDVNEIYDRLAAEILDPDEDTPAITLLLRARQKVEALKVPLLTEMTEDLLEEGKSVVIFVNFKDTRVMLFQNLRQHHVAQIYGGQHADDRDRNIYHFQKDVCRVCICMIQAGGVGVSLHDVRGEHPRVSLICPNYNAVELKQALGRIHRAGGKSKSIQRIVFAANTVEEKACDAVKRKLKNISLLNDGDLTEGIV